jgi:hypothetical protein
MVMALISTSRRATALSAGLQRQVVARVSIAARRQV